MAVCPSQEAGKWPVLIGARPGSGPRRGGRPCPSAPAWWSGSDPGTTAGFAPHDLAARLEDGELRGPVEDPAALAASLLSRAGVAEAGPFCGLASDLIIVGPGGVRHREIRGRG